PTPMPVLPRTRPLPRLDQRHGPLRRRLQRRRTHPRPLPHLRRRPRHHPHHQPQHGGTMTTPKPTTGERVEGVALVLILLVIGGAAAAASFTHIHDWTMANSPHGTGDWFGWANAVISDLVPLGVGLEVRRRRRHNLKIGAYP